jgi:hypothetical protein
MASKEQIKDAILKVAGYPDTGIVAEYADAWATAITSLDMASSDEPVSNEANGNGEVQQEEPTKGLEKEVRVTKPEEVR